MKKLFTYVAVAMASLSMAVAQIDTTGGPDDFGYSWTTSDDTTGAVTYNWIDISGIGTQVTGLQDDGISSSFDVGFNFPFYWYEVNRFAIGSNGYLHFSEPAYSISSSDYGQSGDQSFPSFPYNDPQGNANNLVAPLMCDLHPTPANSTNANIYYYSNDADTLIVTYENLAFWSDGNNGAGSNTFQVILSGVDSSITFQYKTQTGSWASTYDAAPNPGVIGIESKAGQAGLTVSDGNKPYDSLAIKFTLVKNSSFSLKDVAIDWQKNNLNAATFGMTNHPTHINVKVANTGDSDVSEDITVTTDIKKYNKGQLASVNIFSPTDGNNFTISSLNSGASEEYTYSEALVPANELNNGEPGTYIISSSLTLSGDGVSDNNSVESEYVILDEELKDSLSLNYFNLPDNTQGEPVGQFGFSNGGIYVDLPFYPVTLKELFFYAVTDGNAASAGMFLKVYGRAEDGSVGDLIYDTYVPSSLIQYAAGATDPWLPTVVDVDDESTDADDIVINDVGFYYSFETEDDVASGNYGILEDVNAPFSLRTFEIQAGSWGAYRGASAGDMMIGVVADATNATTGIAKEELKGFSLGSAYPNPSNGLTSIDFTLDKATNTRFTLTTMLGQNVQVKEFGKIASGNHRVTVDATDLEPGIYFYSIEVGTERLTKKLIIK